MECTGSFVAYRIRPSGLISMEVDAVAQTGCADLSSRKHAVLQAVIEERFVTKA